jgi:prephenate dehydratase
VIVACPESPPLDLAIAGSSRRTTLVVAVRNEPGTLLEVLRVFAEHGLNMHKLESRPSRERAWEYVFWVDLDADMADPATARAFGELERVTTMARVLGCYPAAPAK